MTNEMQNLCAIIDRFKECGADWAIVMEESTLKNTLSGFAQKRFVNQTIDNSVVTITVYKDGRQGRISSQCANTDQAKRLADEAWAVMKAAEATNATAHVPVCGRHLSRNMQSADIDVMKLRYGELMETAEKRFPRVKFRVCELRHIQSCRRFLDLEGNSASEQSAWYELSGAFSAVGETYSTSYSGVDARFAQLDMPLLDNDYISGALELSQKMLLPPGPAPKQNIVVFSPATLTMLMYMLTNSQLTDNAVISGTSRWSKMLGKKVTDEAISLSIAPTSESIVGECLLTDVGTMVEDQVIIEKGILKSMLLSARGEEKTNIPQRRNQSGCMVMDAGEMPLDRLIADIESGILVGRLSGGSPTLSGEISAIAKMSFLIENGRITRPCEGVAISGNLLDALYQADGISRELSRGGNTALPYLRTSKLNLSGGSK